MSHESRESLLVAGFLSLAICECGPGRGRRRASRLVRVTLGQPGHDHGHGGNRVRLGVGPAHPSAVAVGDRVDSEGPQERGRALGGVDLASESVSARTGGLKTRRRRLGLQRLDCRSERAPASPALLLAAGRAALALRLLVARGRPASHPAGQGPAAAAAGGGRRG